MFTLIIPSHNRHNYLKRSIEYYSLYKVDIVIVDSSEISLGFIDTKNIRYIHLPGCAFAEKILYAAGAINKKFIALCADDDFLFVPSLQFAVEKAVNDSQISLSFGRYLGANKDCSTGFKVISPIKPWPSGKGSKKKLAGKFMSNYQQLLWSLYRKDVFYTAFEAVKKANYSNDNFIELTVAAVSLSLGKISFQKGYWGCREIEQKEHWGGRHKPISELNSKDAVTFVEMMSDISTSVDPTFILRSYLKPSFSRKYLDRYQVFLQGLVSVPMTDELRELSVLMVKYSKKGES